MQQTAVQSIQSDLKKGIQAGMSIAVGYVPVALTFGLLAKTTGLTLLEAILMSMLVFAGAAQYISLSLIAGGVGIGVIIFNTFIVNIRHFLMSASLNEKMDDAPKRTKSLYAFGITDETFSVIATRNGKSSASYALGVMLVAYGSWVLNTGAGHLIGASLPDFLQAAMSIALYAMFVGLLMPSLKKSIKVLYLALIAGCINSALILTDSMETGWAIIISTILSAAAVETAILLKRKAGVK
ncbi:AzlC family ABC transporter permease [Jeotgalibacillus sp. ET6]|uniref:AzlC family ABC transporter permease n=1 Tax=Jeotgalibacillus sp. ET6 TaxID=3037260 RepID=UPI0024186466|nr:AzlC family ABC transporter permease [Jeotgalibacillus sp. ET6]MDG5473428.1 AzlC family ABC transporter permease [Jeotgalibacillus sp. ET6]